MVEFYIVTRAHDSIWPGGVVLFWAANSSGYSTTIEGAGKYAEDEAKHICKHPRSMDFMVPCEVAESACVRVVDIDKAREWERKYSTHK